MDVRYCFHLVTKAPEKYLRLVIVRDTPQTGEIADQFRLKILVELLEFVERRDLCQPLVLQDGILSSWLLSRSRLSRSRASARFDPLVAYRSTKTPAPPVTGGGRGGRMMDEKPLLPVPGRQEVPALVRRGTGGGDFGLGAYQRLWCCGRSLRGLASATLRFRPPSSLAFRA